MYMKTEPHTPRTPLRSARTHSPEGDVLERVCGYRSIFYVLFKVSSPLFTPATRILAAQTIRKMRRLLLLPVPEVPGDSIEEDEEEDEKEDEKEEKVVEKTVEHALPSDYNVRDEFIAVAGIFKPDSMW